MGGSGAGPSAAGLAALSPKQRELYLLAARIWKGGAGEYPDERRLAAELGVRPVTVRERRAAVIRKYGWPCKVSRRLWLKRRSTARERRFLAVVESLVSEGIYPSLRAIRFRFGGRNNRGVIRLRRKLVAEGRYPYPVSSRPVVLSAEERAFVLEHRRAGSKLIVVARLFRSRFGRVLGLSAISDVSNGHHVKGPDAWAGDRQQPVYFERMMREKVISERRGVLKTRPEEPSLAGCRRAQHR